MLVQQRAPLKTHITAKCRVFAMFDKYTVAGKWEVRGIDSKHHTITFAKVLSVHFRMKCQHVHSEKAHVTLLNFTPPPSTVVLNNKICLINCFHYVQLRARIINSSTQSSQAHCRYINYNNLSIKLLPYYLLT